MLLRGLAHGMLGHQWLLACIGFCVMGLGCPLGELSPGCLMTAAWGFEAHLFSLPSLILTNAPPHRCCCPHPQVHKVKATGGLAVLGIMIESGGAIPNPAIQTAFVFAPQAAKEQMQASRPVDPMVLLPADNGKGHRPYIHYAGSLTTPPCSEGVDWFVFTQPIKATDKQIIDFMRYVGAGVTYAQNSRPVQPINERKFKYEL